MSDLIDRKTVFDVIDKCILEKLEGDTVEIKESLKLITKIYRISSAHPQRKNGKWIKISPANIYECSECGKNVMTDDISAYDFCHGCGAYMRGENNV